MSNDKIAEYARFKWLVPGQDELCAKRKELFLGAGGGGPDFCEGERPCFTLQ